MTRCWQLLYKVYKCLLELLLYQKISQTVGKFFWSLALNENILKLEILKTQNYFSRKWKIRTALHLQQIRNFSLNLFHWRLEQNHLVSFLSAAMTPSLLANQFCYILRKCRPAQMIVYDDTMEAVTIINTAEILVVDIMGITQLEVLQMCIIILTGNACLTLYLQGKLLFQWNWWNCLMLKFLLVS